MKNATLACIVALSIAACTTFPLHYDEMKLSMSFVDHMGKSADLFSAHKYKAAIAENDLAFAEYEKLPPELQKKPLIQQFLSSLLGIKPMAYDELGMTDEALASTDDYIRRFGLSSDAEIREGVMSSLKIKKHILLQRNPKNKSPLLPKDVFNAEQVRMAFTNGTATIKGRACNDSSASGIVITLLPATPFLMAWKNSGVVGDVTAELPDEVVKISMRKKLGESGYYNFTNIKPGKYFVQAILDKCTSYQTSTLVGYVSDGVSASGIYHYGSYTDCPSVPIDRVIEITTDNEVQTVNLFSSGLGLLCR